MMMMSSIKLKISLVVAFIAMSLWGFGQKTTGYASYYADKFDGRLTASGEKYYHQKMTAAHPSLPFGSIVKVTHLGNNKTVVVRINDRGPFVEGRIIDLSRSAAQELDFIRDGIAKVQIEVMGNIAEIETTSQSAGFYKVSAKNISVSGYGVQVASSQSLANILKAIEELEGLSSEPVIIRNPEETQYYRLIVGHHLSKQSANRVKEKLRKKYPGAFVISLEK